jgi:pyruvate,water dikinase
MGKNIIITNLENLSPKSSDTFGGKACGSAQLLKIISASGRETVGTVPPGFAVSATTQPVERWPAGIRKKFIAKVRELLKKGPIVCRSSAVGEDSAEKSFAGMFETVLNITTEKEALAAAGRCIVSGNSERVRVYAGSNVTVPVGLVVQRQIAAKMAGVCFTIDPMGKDRAVVIEAVPGMADKMVAGQVEPLRFRVYRSGTGAWEILSPANDFISLDKIKALAAGAKNLEEKFGWPLDLEWAIDNSGEFQWLQARPVTATAAPPEYIIQPSYAGAGDGPITIRSNWNVRETMPEPLFPFTWTFWRDRLLPAITTHLAGIPRKSPLLPYTYPLDLVHGRIYFNLNAMLATPFIGHISRRLIATVDSRAGSALEDLERKAILRPRRYPGSKFFLFFFMFKASFISFIKLFRWMNPQKSMRILAADSQAITRRKALHLLSDRELTEEFDLWSRPECSRILYGLQMEIVAMVIYLTAKKAFRKHPEALDLLCTGIPASPTAKISIEIDALTEAAEPLKDIFLENLTTAKLAERLRMENGGKEWLDNFEIFLKNYGHRGPMEFDLGSTRWSDDPAKILETIRCGLKNPQKEKLPARLDRLAKKREAALKKAISASPYFKRPVMRWLARKVESFMPLREAPKHYALYVFQRIRRSTLELGKRLVNKGVLRAAEDVFFLEVEELVALAAGKKVAAIPAKLSERRTLHERFKKEKPPGFFRSDGVPVFEEIDFSTQPAEGILRGIAISGGSAAGTVRILTEPDPTLVQPGDIIVMEYADPGWTPLFPRAAGIVMEVGGLMCHAAVVARELGVPAVFGISKATTILKNGEQVTLNGTIGTVASERFKDCE